MTIQKTTFGHLPDGRAVSAYRLEGEGGLTLTVLDYGATIQALEFEGKDLVLGFEHIEDYLNQNGSYQGATIGRFANRIAGGRFTLGGKTYDVGRNEPAHDGHLHGGFPGFDKQLWELTAFVEGPVPGLRLAYHSPDGEGGFPGDVTASIFFHITPDNALRLEYRATTTKDTPLSLTNHAYFNLNGYNGGTVEDTLLTIRASHITPINEHMIPTGELRPVEGTLFDFRAAKPLSPDIDSADEPQIALCGGYDMNYALDGEGFRRFATARSPKSGIAMDCWTDLPGVQFYAGSTLCEQAGKGGIPLYKRQGFCLETQYYPDSVNQQENPAFPSPILKAGGVYESATEYRFSRG